MYYSMAKLFGFWLRWKKCGLQLSGIIECDLTSDVEGVGGQRHRAVDRDPAIFGALGLMLAWPSTADARIETA